jgi:hypothetical protein
MCCRVAVLAEEAARRELLEVESGLVGAVQEALAGQEDLGRQVAALRDQAAHMNVRGWGGGAWVGARGCFGRRGERDGDIVSRWCGTVQHGGVVRW